MSRRESLTIVRPQVVTDTSLIATDVPEADHAPYNPAATYARGDRVIVIATHTIYESIIDDNNGNDPATTAVSELPSTGTVPPWIIVSATNRWKVFDLASTSQTAFADSCYYEIRPRAAVNGVGLINFSGLTSVRIRLTDPVFGVVYDKTFSLARRLARKSWWSWYYEQRTARTDFYALDLPNYPTATLRIDLDGGADAKIGVIMFGAAKRIGFGVEKGLSTGIRDYSVKRKNSFGDVSLQVGAFSRWINLSVLIKNDKIDDAFSRIASFRGSACLWIASNKYQITALYGYYEDAKVLIPYSTFSQCSITLEGLSQS